MPRCIDDVDAVVVPADRGVLREDRDASLALQGIRVHDPVRYDRTGRKGPGLLEKLVDQRRLAVVDVRDNRDVTKVSGGVDGHDGAPGEKGRGVYRETGDILLFRRMSPVPAPQRADSADSTAGIDSTASPAASRAGSGFSAAVTMPTTIGTEKPRTSLCTLVVIFAETPM